MEHQSVISEGQTAFRWPFAWRRARESTVQGKSKPQSQKGASKAHTRLRSPGEQLKDWRILRKVRCCR